MRLELELKAPAELDKVKGGLEGLGATLEAEEEQVDVYLQHPCRDFSSTDEALRLRRQRGVVLLTYKGPRLKSGLKARREVEVEVSSFEDALTLLKQLGFEEVATIRKHRSTYELAGFKVHLDRVEGLGSFVEVEGAAEASSIEEAERALTAFARSIGVRLEEATAKSYLELYLEGAGRA